MDLSQIIPHGEKNKKKKSGGFQSMNLSQPVLRAILKKGYKVPTPIQRKTIPILLEGKNVVAMARTGSGKTAAFLIPMLEKLKERSGSSKARAIVFSPTRELAIQTWKFTKELGMFTGLRSTLILGGEKIENQFAALHEGIDIIIATPGRFLHVVMEMNLNLSSIHYVVFDEADRLFEMGFQEQLQEILNRLSEERQTLLFSATLPKVLIDFVRAGVEDPVLIRLDVDMQFSENLKNSYLLCRTDDKPAILLHLLKNVIDMKNELTVVFLATKHHVEYMKDILEKADIPCSYIYSSMDQVARTISVAKFRTKKVSVMLVTDIAARGIDIPLLDNAINFNFPAKPKLFVHRVGRVARAGRLGRAFSFVTDEEAPYLLDLHMFLGRPIMFAKANMKDEDGVCGTVPQSIIDEETDILNNWHKMFIDLENMLRVTKNAYKQYVKSRPTPSSESAKRMKEFRFTSIEAHPIFKGSVESDKSKLLAEMKNFRPNTTIFEFGKLGRSNASKVMKEIRKSHSKFIKRKAIQDAPTVEPVVSKLTAADENDLKGFNQNVIPKTKKELREQHLGKFKDTDHYLNYVSSEHYKEKGLEMFSSFDRQAKTAVLDLAGDENEVVRKVKNSVRWDRKKKKFVNDDINEKSKKMKTESGAWIPKSYKTGLYGKWKEQYKLQHQESNDNDDGDEFGKQRPPPSAMGKRGRNRGDPHQPKSSLPPKRELKSKDEVLKARLKREKRIAHLKRKQGSKSKRKNLQRRKGA